MGVLLSYPLIPIALYTQTSDPGLVEPPSPTHTHLQDTRLYHKGPRTPALLYTIVQRALLTSESSLQPKSLTLWLIYPQMALL